MKYVVELKKFVIVEANNELEAEELYNNNYNSLYEEEEIDCIHQLPADSLYNDYC